MEDHYQLLGLAADASPDDIKQAFRRQARLYHPDLHPEDPQAAEKFQRLRRAYEVLIDARQREAYDRQRADSTQSTQSARGKPQNTGRSPERDAATTTSPQVAYVRGVEKLQQQDYLSALAHLGRALALDPHFGRAYLQRCEVLLQLGRDRDILDDCQHLLRLQPDCADAYYYRGRARQHLGYLQAAIQAYTKALRLGSERRTLHYYRGNAYNEAGERHNALRDWRRYGELCKQSRDERGYRSAQDVLARYGEGMVPGDRIQQALTIATNYLRACTGAASRWLREPVSGMPAAYTYIGAGRGKLAGGIYAGIVAGSAQVSWLGRGLPAALSFNGWPWVGLVAIPAICFLGTGAIATHLSEKRAFSFNAGAFLAGMALLPWGIWALAAIVLRPVSLPLLIGTALFAACWSILGLYGGFVRLLGLSETAAAFAVPSAIATSAWLAYCFALLMRQGAG